MMERRPRAIAVGPAPLRGHAVDGRFPGGARRSHRGGSAAGTAEAHSPRHTGAGAVSRLSLTPSPSSPCPAARADTPLLRSPTLHLPHTHTPHLHTPWKALQAVRNETQKTPNGANSQKEAGLWGADLTSQIPYPGPTLVPSFSGGAPGPASRGSTHPVTSHTGPSPALLWPAAEGGDHLH